MYGLLRTRYYWAGMREMCERVCASALPKQLDRRKWEPPGYLLLRAKDSRPFAHWCVDLVTKLRPLGPRGE